MTTTEIRIEGMLKNIKKSQATLARHQARLEKKAQECRKLGIDDPETWDKYTEGRTDEQCWAKCDYDSCLKDIKNTENKISEFQERLQYWRDKKKAEDKRNEVPMIPAVEEFLQNWRKSADKWYRSEVESLKKWQEDYKVYKEQQISELKTIFGDTRVDRYWQDEEVKKAMRERKVDRNYAINYEKSRYSVLVRLLSVESKKGFEEKLNKELDSEVIAKRVDLYHRCSAVVGVITDASGLRTGSNGSINGIVIGENGKAKVETIMAGGYAIQCLHYRVLVNPIKDSSSVEKQPKNNQKAKSDKEFNFKEKSIEELTHMSKDLKIDFDFSKYSDERILRMRLVMALKQNM